MPQPSRYHHNRNTAGKRGDEVTSHRIRATAALAIALLVSAIVQLLLIHMPTLNIFGVSVFVQFFDTLLQTFLYGLPMGIAAVGATEYLRLRRANVQIAIATALTFVAAHLATRNEPMSSFAFTGGNLTLIGIVASGVAAAATYWAIAGRYAGWRGAETESEYERAAKALLRASEYHAKPQRCDRCLAGWAAASATIFALFSWLVIDVSGLRAGLLSASEDEAGSALKMSGYAWASFKVDDSRGAINGNAPDELEKRMAHDTVREALNAVVGFPGVLSHIDDQALAQNATSAIDQKLAEAMSRERQANQAIEEARHAAEIARAAQVDANRMKNEQAVAVEAERMQMLDQQQSERIAQQVEAQRGAAETLAKNFLSEPDVPALQADALAAVEAEAPSAEKVGASVPEPVLRPGECTTQDVAIVESSHIIFEPQTFDIAPAFQRDLDRMAASVNSCASQPILVTGYSDNNADRLFNPALGLQRADAVRDALIVRGVSATRIATKATPIGFSADADGSVAERHIFRRTDFKFLEAMELSRDATQNSDERASNCETDLSDIMAKSIIHFPIASARVSDESLGLISKLAGAIQNCGSVIVTVEGHTDKIGSPERNQQLSIARANAVREALVAIGADPTRLASRGFASTRPFANDETAEAYALNRRIEFRVSGKFVTTSVGSP